MNIPEINFGNCIYDTYEGTGVYVKSYGEVSEDNFNSYVTEIKNLGFELSNTDVLHNNTFHTLVKGNNAIYLAYYPDICEMRAVYEENSLYLDYENKPYNKITTTTITQIDVYDFGLSYVIRLCDGRFIIFDGGFEREDDADKLMNVLKSQSVTDEICIAAWIMTHPHIDHYRCFMPFMKKYKDVVTVEYMMYNFPSTDKEMQKLVREYGTGDERIYVDKFTAMVEELNIPVLRPHTGQLYDFANAHFEVLSSLDDTFFLPAQELNPLSLILKMTVEEQTVLWTGDAYFDLAKMAERWGTYLKSDIVQLPHHGFCGGREQEYDLIDAKVCLAPVFEIDAFETIDIYFPFNRHLIYKTDLQEFMTGGPGGCGTFTLELPYYPEEGAREKLLERIDMHQHKTGELNWHFDNVVLSKSVLEIYNHTIFDSNADINVTYEDGAIEGSYATAVKRTTVEVDLSKHAIDDDEAASIDIKSELPIRVTLK